MIEVRDVHKSFGPVQAVRGVSFKADDGKITGLLGPNGAGKSTTLRILYTVMTPDSGSAFVDGVDVVQKSTEARSLLGALPQGAGLYPHLSARENIVYHARLRGMSKQSAAHKAESIIAMLEIADFADRRTQGFSQGQRTKVAIARALIHEPQNIILDEPTNGLDVMATRSLRELVRKLQAAGKCVLFSSHVMQEVAALCDEIVIIAHGQVVAQGTAEQIIQESGSASLEDAFVHAIAAPEDLR